jgi:ferrous iron transport protein B
MYAIGLVVAPLVALCLKSSLLRGETPAFVMEMPLYKWPAWRTVLQRMTGSASMFLRRAGTMILATMIIVWALLYFPASHPEGGTYDDRIESVHRASIVGIADGKVHWFTLPEMRKRVQALAEENAPDEAQRQELAQIQGLLADLDREENKLRQEWSEQSCLGRMGKWIEPATAPLGWDWRVGMAALASFPAREVMVGTLGLIYNQGKGDSGDEEYRQGLGTALKEGGFTAPVALSVMVFCALCCQCASTLVVIRRETNSWRWPVFTFVYMTVLAYVGALVVFQIGHWVTG